MVTKQETIRFKVVLEPQYWDKPPMIEISVDNTLYFNGAIDKLSTIDFMAELKFEKHTLTLTRYGKTLDQTALDKDQLILIKSIEIDGIDIQNIVWSSSFFKPEYPEPWASQQRQAGIELEQSVLGETFLGHNGTWQLDFSSPFYKFLIDKAKNQL